MLGLSMQWASSIACEDVFDAVVVHDDGGRFVDVNPAACELFALRREQLVGKRLEDFAPPSPGPVHAWDELMRSGRAVGRIPVVDAEGARFTVEYRSMTDVVPGRHLSVLHDVSDRVNAMSRSGRLQQMSARLVEESSPAAVFELVVRRSLREFGVRSGWLGLLDPIGTAIRNPQYVGTREDVDASPEPPIIPPVIQSISIDDPLPMASAIRERRPTFAPTAEDVGARWPLLGLYHPEAKACAAVPLVLRGRTIGAIVLIYEEPQEFDEEERAFILGAAQLCAAAIDRAAAQSALEDSEQAQRFLADAGMAFARTLDEEETLRTVSDVVTRHFADFCLLDLVDSGTGRSARAAAGCTDSDPRREVIAAELGRLPWFELVRRAEEGGASRADGGPNGAPREPLLVRDFDGSRWLPTATSDEARQAIRAMKPYSLLVVPLRGRGEPLGTLTLLRCCRRAFEEHDVFISTEFGRRSAMAIESARLYAEARRARAVAEEASLAKDQFLAVLGHELRNPLAPIVTALQFMRIRGNDAFERERSIIERQVDHLTRLVDDLLDVSRITRGKLEIRRQPVEIRSVVAAAVETVEPMLERRRHRLSVQVPDEPVRVFGDAERLTQLFGNLLSNATKFTPSDGAIRIVATVVEDTVRVSVQDTGVGIAADLLPHVFETFVQGVRKASVRAGLGLGLTIARSLAELHGGRVTGASEGVGKGSEFVVELPQFVARSTGRTVNGELGLPSATTRSVRVLVVDDNLDAAEMLADALGTLGHEVSVAEDGPTALASAGRAPPEVALLDVGLPVMDGYEVARRIRALPGCAGTRFIALTGYGQESDQERSRKAGFELHLVKPVDLDAVTRAVARQA
jgi:PAS domain S-box-containing protein